MSSEAGASAIPIVACLCRGAELMARFDEPGPENGFAMRSRFEPGDSFASLNQHRKQSRRRIYWLSHDLAIAIEFCRLRLMERDHAKSLPKRG